LIEQDERKKAKTPRRTTENEIRADKDPRVEKLLEFAETVNAQELVPVLEEEATELVKEDPFAFALAGVLDRGTKAEIIWTIPYYIKKQLGDLDPYFFANASLEELERIIQKLPVKPRYVTDAPHTLRGLSRIIVNECNGQAQRLWENKSSKAVQATFERIYGVGPGIASMIILLLERWFGVHFDDVDHRNMDVKPDVHIIRVFHRLGFIDEPDSHSALEAARRLNPDYPGELDSPAWVIGRTWCTASIPQCKRCPVNEVCPKTFERTRMQL
jgi:endonuclease-3